VPAGVGAPAGELTEFASLDHEAEVLRAEAALAGWLQADGFVGQYERGTNRSLTIEFQVALDPLPAGTRVHNQAALEWTSLPDDNVSAPYSLSPHNALSTERRYDPATGADFYQVVASATVSTPALPATYLAQLNALQSMGAVVMVLSLKQQLSEQGYYWHNLPKEAGFPFLAMCEHTNFVSPEHFGGDHLIYCGDYLPPDHEYFRLTEGELLERYAAALPRFNPQFERSWIKQVWLFRETYAQPIPPLHHSQHIPDLRTPLPGLYFASMSQVYPWDRGTNYAVEIGRRAARLIASDANHR